jgi:primosomal protein N' (replication factor Y) (superfamily II helicase)
VYLQLIEQALNMKRAALLMVPEISLTPQLSRRLLGRFGDRVAVWHSALSAGERYDTWRRMQAGDLKVILGARSAVLTNIPDLGLIILDEEHDSSYKQTSPSPRYSAKKLAIERARREGALVLLGSATPDAVTYSAAREVNHVLELPERVHKQALPESVIVDMRTEVKSGNRGLFSEVLKARMSQCLARQEQVILLMNRRGYASHIFCRSCGHVVKCKNCSVSLVFHNPGAFTERNSLARGWFTCHHCGYSKSATEICPACTSPFLRQFGLGTQRVEEETRQIFPDARTLRLDSDITARKGATEAIFKQFADGEADILIGTQMIAKGIDIARVTLVGVIAADAAFNLPDYRALERGFQLLTQVSGRAGRGHAPGSVVLQTFNPDLPALDLARKQDYQAFITDELQCRKDFAYPPFSELIRIVVAALDDNNARSEIEILAEELSNYLDDLVAADAARILGPAPCLVEKLKNYYRYHLLIKNVGGDSVRSCISTFLKARRRPQAIRFTIDIDPVDLL